MDLDLSPKATTGVLAVWSGLLVIDTWLLDADRLWLALFVGALAVLSVPLGRRMLARSQSASDLTCAGLLSVTAIAAAVDEHWLLTGLAAVMALVFLVASRRHQIYERLGE
jgi:peptidoglycan/LPS O-acetylase OafA/YrhL